MDCKRIVLCILLFIALLAGYARSEETLSDDGSLVLAAKRTSRPDPLNRFDKYTGGWNITDRHYWASVGSTGVPLFVIGGAWFIIFGLVLFISVCCCCCCSYRAKSSKGHRNRRPLVLSLLFLLALATIAGSFLLYFGEENFNKKILGTLEYVVSKADYTEENLRNVTDYLEMAKSAKIYTFKLPSRDQKMIGDISRKLTSAANELGSETQKNSENIRDYIEAVRRVLIGVAAATVALSLLALVLSFMNFRELVYFLMLAAWFVVAATFIFSGLFVMLYNAVTDACVAMDEWVSNPTAKTALDKILPCVDRATAQQSLNDSKAVTSDVVSLLNQFIDGVANRNATVGNVQRALYNQSGRSVPNVCDPYNTTKCPTSQVTLSQAPQVWKGYVCNVSSTGICNSTGRLTPNIYSEMATATNGSYGLYKYAPFLANLSDCQYVREAFSTITNDYCNGLRDELRRIFIGLAIVSASLMFAAIFWLL